MQDDYSKAAHAARHLSPTEAAKKLGVSAKALRVYERHGLIKPVRGANGYRAYGPAEMARLHQVLALKALGLSLSKISGLLAGRLAALDALLELQEHVLGREADRLAHALALVRAARARLATGGTLSIDELANLTMETTMTAKPTDEDMRTLFEPHIARHFTQEDRTKLAEKAYDQQAATKAWDCLVAEARALMAKGDPDSPEALDLARRWKAMVEQFTGGDPAVLGKLQNVWSDALSDPNTAPKLPVDKELMGFVMKASARLYQKP